jgi:hypothetical protein
MRGRPSWLTSSADESAMSSSPGPARGGLAPVPRRARAHAARPDASRSLALRAEGVLSPTSPMGSGGAGGTPLPHSLELADVSGRKRDAPPRGVRRLIASGGAARRASVKAGSVASSHRPLAGRCMCTRHLRVPAEAGTSRVDSVTTALIKVGRDGRRASALPPAVGGSERGPIGTRRGKPPRRPRGSLTLAA